MLRNIWDTDGMGLAPPRGPRKCRTPASTPKMCLPTPWPKSPRILWIIPRATISLAAEPDSRGPHPPSRACQRQHISDHDAHGLHAPESAFLDGRDDGGAVAGRDILLIGYGSKQQQSADIRRLYRKGWQSSRIIMGQTLVASLTPSPREALDRLHAA
jgi:hypothetical protein